MSKHGHGKKLADSLAMIAFDAADNGDPNKLTLTYGHTVIQTDLPFDVAQRAAFILNRATTEARQEIRKL